MNTLQSMFPDFPTYKGSWQTVYLEPIIGSEERIAIVVVAMGQDSKFKTLQSIRPELLECLYGDQASNMQGMINWVMESVTTQLEKAGNLEDWTPPFNGLKTGECRVAADDNLDGILRQAIRCSASLSELALDADRDESSDDDPQTKRRSNQWTSSVEEELKAINPRLAGNFRKRLQISSSDAKTTYGFYTESYVSNFGLLVPIRLSSSLTTIKARILDLEALKKSQFLTKPDRYEVILGVPSFDDPTLTKNNIKNVKDSLKMLEDYSAKEGITIFNAQSAYEAADHIIKTAA